ncbi:phospholipase, partial [Mycobacterium tuberculosis]
TLNARDQPPAEVSDQRVSGLTGAVHAPTGGRW